MRPRKQVIKELVLEAVANDYEDFTYIEKDVQERASKYGAGKCAVSREEVLTALQQLICEDHVRAYNLSAASPGKAVQVTFSATAVGELWFYITPHGKSVVRILEDSE
jgi:peroxiredoxin